MAPDRSADELLAELLDRARSGSGSALPVPSATGDLPFPGFGEAGDEWLRVENESVPPPGDRPAEVPVRARHRAVEPPVGEPSPDAVPPGGRRAARRAAEAGGGRAAEASGRRPSVSLERSTQPLPVLPAAGRHQAGTAAPRHRSAAAPRRPVSRSLVGALAVIGVVGGVELTAASWTGSAGRDTARGPSTDPTALSGLHALAPQFTPTRPGADDGRPPTAALPEPRPAVDDRDGDRDGAPAGPDRDDRTDGDRTETDRNGADRNGANRNGADGRDGNRGPGGLRAGGPVLPDLPGLDLPGLLPTPRSKAVSTANCGKPGKILDLANWKLTLPTGSSGDPTEIVGSALGALTDKHFGTDNRCDAVAFRAPVNGVTTKGSKNPRSELREMAGGGKAGWSSSSGTHTMTVREAFTRLPTGKPHLVGAQIHDASDDITVFRLEGTKLWVTNGDNPNFKLADADYKLGTPFEAKFVVSGGQTRAYYNGKLVATIAKSYGGAYFKAGAYTQANCGNAPCSADNYGETLIYGLDVKHS